MKAIILNILLFFFHIGYGISATTHDMILQNRSISSPNLLSDSTSSCLNGYTKHEFEWNGKKASIIAPKVSASFRPWILRLKADSFYSEVDIDLLGKGFFVVSCDLPLSYSKDVTDSICTAFYEEIRKRFQLCRKVTLEAKEGNGHIFMSWALNNSKRVACLYWDNPQGDSLKNVNRSTFRRMAKKQIPIISKLDNWNDSLASSSQFHYLFETYQKFGGPIQIVTQKKGVDRCRKQKPAEPITDFIISHQREYTKQHHIHYRSMLTNAFRKFVQEKKGTVAFLGGSITQMIGWRNQIQEDLQQRFPDTDFCFIDAGIGSTGSVPHAFRMEHDVFQHGIPDLLFVEAAVNDNTNMPGDVQKYIRGMEGVIRHALIKNPYMDVVMLHFMCDPFRPYLEKGIIPDVIMNHERVANYYGVTSINLAQEIHERMADGQFDWKYFKGTHPSWDGHKYYTAAINRVFDWSMKSYCKSDYTSHEMLEEALDKYSYFPGRFLDISQVKKCNGFKIVDKWTPEVTAKTREGFVNVPMLTGLEEGASFELKFTGKVIGILGVCGPESCLLSYSIDGKRYKSIDTYTKWSNMLYIPWATILADELSEGEHVLRLSIKKGKGTACHIRNFMVTDTSIPKMKKSEQETSVPTTYYFEEYQKE